MDYLTAISSAVMALVWVVYFQVFLRQYKRQNRPFLVIHHAQDQAPESACMLVNMSQEPVHIQCVLARVETGNGGYTLSVTDYRRLTPEDQNVQQVLRQGPIQPGGYLLLGSFRDIVLGRRSEDEEDNAADTLAEVRSLEIRVAVVHGPSRFPIGARRRFLVETNDNRTCVRATNIHTEQLITRRTRDAVREWIEQHLEPERLGRSETQESNQGNDM